MFGLNTSLPIVTAEDLKQAIDENRDVVILDVRTPDEYTKAKIKGSINIPVDSIATEVEEIVTDKNKIIYVYCLSGSRSNIAVDTMQKLGYKNVFDVKSGLLAWRANQYPLEG